MYNIFTRCFVFFSTLLFSLPAIAQIKGTLNYKLTINDGFTGEPRTMNFVTYFSGSKSVEVPIPKALKPSLIADGDNSLVQTNIVSTKKSNFVFKNFSAKQLLVGDNVQRNFLLVDDTLSNFKWKITNQTRKILNYNCAKATTTFRGRSYEAWFTDDIAITNGPWKFCGLPGLIVAVNDSESIYKYELTGIDLKANFSPSVLAMPQVYAQDKAITHKAFIAALNKKIKENEALSRAALKADGANSSNMTISLPPKMEKF